MTKSNRYNRKWIGAIIAISAVGTLFAVSWYYTKNWKATLRTKLEETISTASNKLYTLTYDDISINLSRGSIAISNVELRPDSMVYQDLAANKQASDNLFHVKATQLRINGLSIWGALFSKKLSIDKIIFDNVELHITHQRHPYKEGAQNDSIDIYDTIKETFKSIRIGEIQFTQADVKFSNIQKGTVRTKTMDNIELVIWDFLLNKQSARDSTRLLYTKGIELNIPGFTYDIANSPYKIQSNHFHLNSKDKHAFFNKASLVPKISKSEYFKTDTANKALINLKFDSLNLKNIDLQKMIAHGLLYAEYAYINGGTASFQKDKRYQKDNVNKIGQAPHQQLMKLKQILRIDTVFVVRVDVSYSEYSAKYDRVGEISFEQTQGTITNLTNDTSQLAQDQFMRADLRAKLMGAGNLHAQFSFDMLSDLGSYGYQGTLNQMKAHYFNDIVKPLLNMEFDSGNIRSIKFDMLGTDYKQWGEFRFDYDDMQINILHKPKKGKETSKKDVLSFIVNQFLLNNSNPSSQGSYRIGQVDHMRVPEYSHFKTIWKTLLEGIQQSVGLTTAGKIEHKASKK